MSNPTALLRFAASLLVAGLIAGCGTVQPLQPDAGAGPDAGAPDGPSPDGMPPDGTTARCGDGHRDPAEACDGADLGEQSCNTLGFPGGTLRCDGACRFDTDGCTVPATCGNDTIDGDEQCDGARLGDATCRSLGYVGGDLRCGGGCRYDVSGCTNCGNDRVDTGERCDGTDLADQTCVDVGPFSGGALACNATCDAFVTAGCRGAPTVPRLRLPQNNAYLGSSRASGTRRPLFVWEPSSVDGDAGIRYELQYDTSRSFTAAPVTVTATVTNHQVADDLAVSTTPPVGTRYYWRVRACAGNACSDYSAPWWINVGRSDRDFNGDGFSDVWIAAPGFDPPGKTNAGRIYLYLGGASINTGTPSKTFDGEAAGDALGGASSYGAHGLAYLGDVNGDGFSDVAFGANGSDGNGASSGRVYVHYGANPPNYVADLVLDGPAAGDEWGRDLAPAGDVDADGYDDMLLTAWPNVDQTDDPDALLFLGSATGLAATPADHIDAGPAIGGGDINGDGFADVLGSPPRYLGESGVWLGSAELLADAPSVSQGTLLAAAGDVNGDGFSDWAQRIIVCSTGCSYAVTLALGGRTPDGSSDFELVPHAPRAAGSAICGIGDWSGGGTPDLVIDTTDANGSVYLFRGEPPFDSPSDATFAAAGLGGACARAGDINGDGHPDLLLANRTGAGSVLFYSGQPANVTADATFTGAADGDKFGASVE